MTDPRPYPARTNRDPAFVRLSERFDEAFAYAAANHREQARKGPVPYLAHLMGVASLVLEYGGDEDQAIAALLHDTVEDCGAEHVGEIRKRFGDAVTEIVLACSDAVVRAGERKGEWTARKTSYIAHLEHLGAGHAALLVSCADKLHNTRAIRSDLRTRGLALWGIFSMPAPDQFWYYRSLDEAFRRLLPGPLADELHRTVEDIAAIDADLRRA